MKNTATMNITISYDNKSVSADDLKAYLAGLSKALLKTTPLIPYGWIDELTVEGVKVDVTVDEVQDV